MAKNSNGYDRNYYRDVRRYKTLGFKAVAAGSCQLCGDEWANTHVGYNAEIFVCSTCSSKLSKWDREKEMERRKMDALCQVCYVDPAISLHESSQLRCCCGCSAWLSEGEAEGSQRWKPAEGDPWDTDEKLGHIFETGQGGVLYGEPDPASFADIPGIQALCGILSPPGPRRGNMDTPPALRRFGLCVACLKACPDPAHLFHPRHQYFAYVIPVPVGQAQEIAPAVGTS